MSSTLDRLISYLLEMEPSHSWWLNYSHSKYETFRGLMNLWEAYSKLPYEAFTNVQNRYLQEELGKKGIISVMSLAATDYPKIALFSGDITRLSCDAIVNPTSGDPSSSFAPAQRTIDSEVYYYSGVQLRYECHKIMKARKKTLDIGEVILTHGYNLPAKYVLHTRGPQPMNERINHRHEKELESCYENIMKRATELGLRSVAIPSISTGEERFPKEAAAQIAVRTVDFFLVTHEKAPVVVFCPSEEDFPYYDALLNEKED